MGLNNILDRLSLRQGQLATVTKLEPPSTWEAASPPSSGGKIYNSGLVRGMILLAEDNSSVRELVARVLSEEGYAVFPAEDEDDAISIAEDIAYPELDLLLTDVVMPLMGGMELADRVKAIHPETRVIYMSAYTDAENQQIRKRLKGGDASFISKPFALDVVTSVVEDTLGK